MGIQDSRNGREGAHRTAYSVSDNKFVLLYPCFAFFLALNWLSILLFFLFARLPFRFLFFAYIHFVSYILFCSFFDLYYFIYLFRIYYNRNMFLFTFSLSFSKCEVLSSFFFGILFLLFCQFCLSVVLRICSIEHVILLLSFPQFCNLNICI